MNALAFESGTNFNGQLELPTLDEVNVDIHKLNGFQRQLQNMIICFDAIFRDVESRVNEVNLRTTWCEENILSKVSTRFATNVTHHMTHISDYVAAVMKDFQPLMTISLFIVSI